MNYFPNNDEEISMIKFIAKFQYLTMSDTGYFFNSKKYYKSRITKLLQKKYIRKTKNTLVLDEFGIEYCKLFNYEYTKLNRNKQYFPRLLYISNLGAYYYSSSSIEFKPSYSLKDKEMFTVTARKFIGVMDIGGIEHLVYHISNEHSKKYIMSVIYDIQKEQKYRNIIVLVDDMKKINIKDFTFGYNQTLIIEDNEKNRDKLKYIHNMNWSKVIQKLYRNNVYLAEYKFCDYTDYKNKYISFIYFYDTEKINRIRNFLRENRNKNVDIICSEELKEQIKKELPNANYIIIDLENYIDRKRNIYD